MHFIKQLAALALLLAPSAAPAQVLQTGSVTPGHVAVWATNGVLTDGGAATNGSVVNLGLVGTGTPFCINDAPVTSSTGYHQLCLGANAAGGGLISYQAYGGAAALPLYFTVNGSTPSALPSTYVQTFAGLSGVITAGQAATALGGTTSGTLYPGNNPSAFITAGGAPVQSVAGNTGTVTVAELYTALEGTGAGTLYPGANPSAYVAAPGAITAAWAGSGFGFTTAPTAAQVAAAVGAVPLAVPTAAPGTNTTQAASTAFVTNAVTAATAGVASFNTRTGAVTLTSGDVTTALTFTPYNATNPSNYIAASGAPVQSVAGNTGTVTALELYTALEGTGANTLYPGNNPSGYVTATSAPVTSVATLTGAVTKASLQAQLVGTTSGTLAAGNDSRITGACQTTGCTMAGALTPSTTNGIVGTAAADNANAGSVGEYLSATGTSTAMTATTYTTLTSLTLTAGDWDVSGTVQLICSTTTTGIAIGGVSTTSAAAPVFPNFWELNINGQGAAQFAVPVTRFDVAGSTPVYAIGYQTCTSGTITGMAFLRARRVR